MAEQARTLILDRFWRSESAEFCTLITTDKSCVSQGGMETYLLLNRVLHDKIRIDSVIDAILNNHVNIEIRSHHPEILYHYGFPEEARSILLEISDPATERRDYPEVSFAVVGAMLQGMMGIDIDVPNGLLETRPNLSEETPSAGIKGVPFGAGTIEVEHGSVRSSTVLNASPTPISWRACFYGAFEQLRVDGKAENAAVVQDWRGRHESCLDVSIEAGQTHTVTV
jgi:hypothetical protein